MDNKLKQYEENRRLQGEMIKQLNQIVDNLKKEKCNLAEDLKEKDKIIYELKKKAESGCINSCDKYSKSIDEIYQAGTKHRDKLIALKEVADKQKETISILREEKIEFLDKVEQLEEDVETGFRIVTNLQTEKDNLKQELKEHKQQMNEKEETIKDSEKEMTGCKKKLNFLKTKLETSLKEYQRSERNNVVKIEELEKDLSSRMEKIQELEKDLADFKDRSSREEPRDVLAEKTASVIALQEENNALAKKNKDLEDEIIVKIKEIDTIKESIDKNDIEKPLQSSASSLADELDLAQKLNFECESCRYETDSMVGLKCHIRRVHECPSVQKTLEMKLKEMETKAYEQKFTLTSTLFKLKEKETFEKQACNCRNFCRINHHKHNWKKSISGELFSKLKDLNVQVEQQVFGAKEDEKAPVAVRSYTCECCVETFARLDALKNHMKIVHRQSLINFGGEKNGGILLSV